LAAVILFAERIFDSCLLQKSGNPVLTASHRPCTIELFLPFTDEFRLAEQA
jgi:hypothetical protein